jgi:ABC-2 type transport system permease protein
MNRALWQKAFSDIWAQLLISCLILAGFSWLFMWLIGLVKADLALAILNSLPSFFQRIVKIPLSDLVSPAGRISVIFQHPITLLVCVGWAVGRGSDSICGEIGRGTMDLLVSLPVKRPTLILIPAVAAALGAAALSASIMLGIALGLLTVSAHENAGLLQFMPGAINLFCMVFCFTAITTFVSSLIRDRWRTIAVAVGIYVLSMIIEIVARLWPAGAWLYWFTFQSAFQPQELVLLRAQSPVTATIYDATLLGIGLFCYAVGIAIFCRRDVPASR